LDSDVHLSLVGVVEVAVWHLLAKRHSHYDVGGALVLRNHLSWHLLREISGWSCQYNMLVSKIKPCESESAIAHGRLFQSACVDLAICGWLIITVIYLATGMTVMGFPILLEG